MNVAGYNIYYRKQPSAEPSSEESGSEESGSEESGSEESGSEKSSSEEPASEESGLEEPSSCSSGESQAVEAPAATITGLEPNTRYAFAIRAFNESESLCSNEITAVTPPAES
ncbi:MAG: fibronectin type III domain-containing protein [Nitrospira sp.]|nr:fibronectin type III domain-containing protein [Nitrospira sp.]